MSNEVKQATPEELRAEKKRCWSPPCKKYAWLRDGSGWKWCLKHWWRNWRWGGGQTNLRSFIYELKSTKVEINL